MNFGWFTAMWLGLKKHRTQCNTAWFNTLFTETNHMIEESYKYEFGYGSFLIKQMEDRIKTKYTFGCLSESQYQSLMNLVDHGFRCHPDNQ